MSGEGKAAIFAMVVTIAFCIGIVLAGAHDNKPSNHRFSPAVSYKVDSKGILSKSMYDRCRRCDESLSKHVAD